MTTNCNPQILIVDDEPQILRVMKNSLLARGYDVKVASDALEAIELINEKIPDLIILDLMMPKLSGFDLCKMVRKISKVPIMILSARQLEDDKKTALDLGACDYITKPFNLNDLLVRMRVTLRRSSNTEIEVGYLRVGDIGIDFSNKKVLVDGKEVELTLVEYDILVYLVNNAGKIITRQNLMNHLFGFDGLEHSQQLRGLVNKLRHKIEPNPEKPHYILIEPGIGYKFYEQPL